MKQRLMLIMALAASALGTACSNQNSNVNVLTAANPNADFTSYHTYAFAQSTDAGVVDTPADAAASLGSVNSAVRTQMDDLGLREVTAQDNPDLFAFSLASTDTRTSLSWSCVPGYWYGSWSWDYTPCTWLTPFYTTYQSGTVVIGLNDPKRQQVVFGGVMQGVLDGTNVQNDLNQGVEEIFKAYPKNQTGSSQK